MNSSEDLEYFWGDKHSFFRFVGHLQTILLIACGIGLLGLLTSDTVQATRLLGYLGFIAIILFSRWVMRFSVSAGVKVLAVGLWIMNSIFLAAFAGVHSANAVVYPLIAGLCGWVLGPRWLGGLVAATVLLMLGLAIGEVTGVLVPTPRASPTLVASVTIGVMICVGFLINALVKDWSASRRKLVELSEQLQSQNQQLVLQNQQLNQRELDVLELNRSLEERVDTRTRELRETLQQLQVSQEGLARSQRLAALGALVAGVSHELNTPLGISVTASTTLVAIGKDLLAHSQSQTLKRSQLQDGLENLLVGSSLVLRNLDRANQLIQSFKQVSVDQTSELRREFQLGRVLSDVLESMTPTLRLQPHQLTHEVESDPVMDSYAGPLGQVVINLVQNAYVHAFHDNTINGTVNIVAKPCLTEAGQPGVHLRVIDNGAGIPAQHLGRIFEPFFTTRMGRGGTGLGLNIAYNIVRDVLGGNITVHSVAGEGTQFDIYLPLVAPVQAD